MTPAEIALTRDPDNDAFAGVPSSSAAPSYASESKCAVMDLAYNEFLRHEESGEPFDLEGFCERYPHCRSALFRLLKWQQFSEDNPQYLEGQYKIVWPKAGERHGDLTLLRELGHGSFSLVFLATEASTGDRLVVVKYSSHGDNEARTQGPLSHPHIVPILSAGQDETTRLMAVRMPYLGSATLEDVLDRVWAISRSAPPGTGKSKAERARKARVIADVLRDCAQPEDPPAVALDPRLRSGHYADGVIHLAVQLAEALAWLHAQGVCHRDLKPSNVLLDPSGKPLLLDFNLSTSARAATQPTGGTLRYMSPELLRAYLTKNWEGVDERAELYALAVILYELLAGSHPYGPIPKELSDPALAELLLERMKGSFRPLREVCPDVERPVARALERCLAVNPADRPRGAAELAFELKRQFTPARRLRRLVAGHPLAVLCILCLFLLGTVAAGLAWAVTPSYSERQYQRGVTVYRAGDYDEAERCFDRAFQADPKNSRYRFARGVARFKQSKSLANGSEKRDQAWNDIQASANGTMDAPSMAFRAYMLNCEMKPDEAIGMYTNLLKEPYRRAMVLNNRGYSYFVRSEKNRGYFALAKKDLDEAARLDPNCSAVLYNRARLVMMHWFKAQALPSHRQALHDIEQAVQFGPTAWKLYADAARLYARAAREEDGGAETRAERIERCLFYLRRALDNGDNTKYPEDPDYGFLCSPLPLSACTPVPPRSLVSETNLCLIDPVELPD